jgi:hypothetical protein
MAVKAWQLPTVCCFCGETYTPRWRTDWHCSKGYKASLRYKTCPRMAARPAAVCAAEEARRVASHEAALEALVAAEARRAARRAAMLDALAAVQIRRRIAVSATPQTLRIRAMKSSAHARRIAWDLTDAEVLSFWQKPCTYCGQPIATVGLGRVDSKLGYCMANVVACCTECSFTKSDKSVSQFIAHCRRVATHTEDKNL